MKSWQIVTMCQIINSSVSYVSEIVMSQIDYEISVWLIFIDYFQQYEEYIVN